MYLAFLAPVHKALVVPYEGLIRRPGRSGLFGSCSQRPGRRVGEPLPKESFWAFLDQDLVGWPWVGAIPVPGPVFVQRVSLAFFGSGP